MKRSALVFAILSFGAAACGRAPRGAEGSDLKSHDARFLFTDVTQSAGIEFVHCHGGSGTHYYVETMGSGCAFLDCDRDGWLDIFLVQGAPLPGFRREESGDRADGGPWRHALFRNQRDGTFREATQEAGLGVSRYGFGCAAADYDNDGDTDIFVTQLDGNALLRNNGDGSFLDVAEEAGVRGSPLSTSAAFLDYDRDGWLDLFVCRYMDYSLEENPRCTDALGRAAYCSPFVYPGTSSRLYRNLGDGSFADVSEPAGIAAHKGRAMGVACTDFDGDGWVDVYVASDLTRNFLFLNQRDGTFREEGALRGAAYGTNGTAQAGMGVDCADCDNDGDADLVVTNFENEPNALYRSLGGAGFVEESLVSGLAAPTLRFLGWGVQFADFDLDGDLDLFVANGHVDDHREERDGTGHTQPCRVYRNALGRFCDVSGDAGRFFDRLQAARGAAFGDYDNDGDTDVLVACKNEPAVLVRNDTPRRGEWCRVALAGRGCNRDALSARVRVRSGPLTQTRWLRSGTSYLSDHDRRLVFALPAAGAAQVEVVWPCGGRDEIEVRAAEEITVEERSCKLCKDEP
jgi:hypothetical protein